MKKIIISGITGFVGSNLGPFLNNRYKVAGLSRKENEPEKIFSYSSFTLEGWNDTFAFIHLAGKAHDLKNSSSEETYFEVNTEITKQLYTQFLKSECQVFIFLSSVKAAADSFQGILDENHYPEPKTAYGRSKLAAEQYLLDQDLPKDKRLYILRPGMIHGPNNKGNLNLLYNLISRGIPYPLGNYNNKRSFVSVDNISFAIEKLLQLKPESGIYNIADDQPLSTRELVQIIAEISGREAKIYSIPKGIIEKIAAVGDILSLPLNSERLGKLTGDYVISNRKCLQAIGTNFPYDTQTGIRKTLESFKP